MEPLSIDKTSVLLQLLSHQLAEIERREGREQKLFEWIMTLLLGAFGVIVALSERENQLPHSCAIKMLATIMIAVPCLLFCWRVRRYSTLSIQNALAVERIERSLRLYQKGEYGGKTPYPEKWRWKFAKNRRDRKTPFLYMAVSVLSAACVIVALWLIL